MKCKLPIFGLALAFVLFQACAAGGTQAAATGAQPTMIRGGDLSVAVFDDGSYALRSAAISGDVLHATVEVDTTAGALTPTLYPRHRISVSTFNDALGTGQLLTVTHSGLEGAADLVCEFRVYVDRPWGDIRVKVTNSTAQSMVIHSIRVIKSSGGTVLQLNGPDTEDRVLSDGLSEDPSQIADLGEASGGIHRSFSSQLIYNRKSGQSLFLGALSADTLVTVFHLRSTSRPDARVLSYDVEDTGTTEALHDQSQPYGEENEVPLRLEVAPGESASSERLMFAFGPDYHAQLENYGNAIRILDHARTSSPTLIGWWSWTAYYYGVTEGTMQTNADWLAQNLLTTGYRYFQIDEGYQFARGEYATADGTAFPDGMAPMGHHVENDGLTFGLWAAPFEVSDRSWVYQHHRDWLVNNLRGEPIHIGKVYGKGEELYALDTTNPGAQEYLRQTYRTLVNDWGARFLKLDFMDAASVEGVFSRPNTTALQALRIGLEVIRETVGDNVVLDKDGSPMLTPVGIVDTGRISQDTGHTFGSTRDAAPGIAGRYYMNRNFYESDPDAFTVSEQITPDRGWHGNKVPLTQDEAEASIALSAVSGGMFEIGDDLPALGASPQRLALVRNSDLLDMARLGRSSVPLDLMTYREEDKQPSVFLLKEDNRQWILTIFNWTEEPRSHSIAFEDLGIKPNRSFTASDVLRGGMLPIRDGRMAIDQPAHSVRMIKLINNSVTARAPDFEMRVLPSAQAGETVEFRAFSTGETPVLGYQWNFGDGVAGDGAEVTHTYTQPGSYAVIVEAIGLDKRSSTKTMTIAITGHVPTIYDPARKERYGGEK
jgi:alpha-galactosidase